MLMYDVDQRDAERKKARREKDEMSQEMKELKKLKETEQLYQREERKLFLGGLSMDTVRKKTDGFQCCLSHMAYLTCALLTLDCFICFTGRERSAETLWRVRHLGGLPGHEGQGVGKVEGLWLRHLQLLLHGGGGAREG